MMELPVTARSDRVRASRVAPRARGERRYGRYFERGITSAGKFRLSIEPRREIGKRLGQPHCRGGAWLWMRRDYVPAAAAALPPDE
jgi:hypothetical protein